MLAMASSWNRLLTVYLLGLWMPVWGSALTRERFFGRIELCNEVFPATSSFPDVSKMHCATKCSESEACTAFSFTTTSGICHLHYDSDLTSYPCTTSSSTSQHFEKVCASLVKRRKPPTLYFFCTDKKETLSEEIHRTKR